MSVLSSRTYRRDPSSPRRISKQNEKPTWFGHVPTHVLTHLTIKRRDKLSARHFFIDHVGCARLCVHGGYGRHLKQTLLSRNLQSCLRVHWEMVPESAKDTISVNAQAPELGLIPAGSTFVGSNNPSWLDSILVESEVTEPKDREGWWHNKMEEKEIHILKTTLQHLVYQLCNKWSLRRFITPTQQNSISNSRNCAEEARAASSMQVFGTSGGSSIFNRRLSRSPWRCFPWSQTETEGTELSLWGRILWHPLLLFMLHWWAVSHMATPNCKRI